MRAYSLAAPVMLAVLAASAAAPRGSCDQVPLFARFSADGATLRAYSAPVHADVTLRKLLSFRFGLDGQVFYRQPDRIALTMNRVPERYSRLFSDLGTPRTWPQTYDLQVKPKSVDGRQFYEVTGVPRFPSQVASLTAELSDDASPIHARYALRDGGTIALTIETEPVGGYLLPKQERAEIDAGGFKVHAEMRYGPYSVNDAATAYNWQS